MIRAIAALDLLAICAAAEKLPLFSAGVILFQSALFLAVVIVRNSQRSAAIARPSASTMTMGYMNTPPC